MNGLVTGAAYLGIVVCAAFDGNEEVCVAIVVDVAVGAGSRFQCVKGLRASARVRARRRVRTMRRRWRRIWFIVLVCWLVWLVE